MIFFPFWENGKAANILLSIQNGAFAKAALFHGVFAMFPRILSVAQESTGNEVTNSCNRAGKCRNIQHMEIACVIFSHLIPNAEEMGIDIIKTNDPSPGHTNVTEVQNDRDVLESLIAALHC